MVPAGEAAAAVAANTELLGSALYRANIEVLRNYREVRIASKDCKLFLRSWQRLR